MLTKLAAMLAVLTLSMIGVVPAAAGNERSAPEVATIPDYAVQASFNCPITRAFGQCYPSVRVPPNGSVWFSVFSDSKIDSHALIWACDYEHRHNNPPNGACGATMKGRSGSEYIGINRSNSTQRILLYLRSDAAQPGDRVVGDFLVIP
jgi:hypothetical protein